MVELKDSASECHHRTVPMGLFMSIVCKMIIVYPEYTGREPIVQRHLFLVGLLFCQNIMGQVSLSHCYLRSCLVLV